MQHEVAHLVIPLQDGLLGLPGQCHPAVSGVHGQLGRGVFKASLLCRLLLLHVVFYVSCEDARLLKEYEVCMRVVLVELHVVPVHDHVQVDVGEGHLVPFLRLLDDGSVFEMFHLIIIYVLELEPREHPVLEAHLHPGLDDVQCAVPRREELHRRDPVRKRIIGHHRRIHRMDVLMGDRAVMLALHHADVQSSGVSLPQAGVQFRGQLREVFGPSHVVLVAFAGARVGADVLLHQHPRVSRCGGLGAVPAGPAVHPRHGHGHDLRVAADVGPFLRIRQIHLRTPSGMEVLGHSFKLRESDQFAQGADAASRDLFRGVPEDEFSAFHGRVLGRSQRAADHLPVAGDDLHLHPVLFADLVQYALDEVKIIIDVVDVDVGLLVGVQQV